MSQFKVDTITNRDGSYGPQVCGITTFGSSGMQLPSGPTEMRGGRGRAIIGPLAPALSVMLLILSSDIILNLHDRLMHQHHIDFLLLNLQNQ